MGMATFLPLGFLSGWGASFLLRKANLLRVPPEVELEGLDRAEYETDFYPEHERLPEPIIEPDGTIVPAEPVLVEEFARLDGRDGRPRARSGAPGGNR